MCAKKASDRYQSCDELIAALEGLGGTEQDASGSAVASVARPAPAEPRTLVMAMPANPVPAPPLPVPPSQAQVNAVCRAPVKPRRRPPAPAQRRNRALLLGGAAALVLLGIAGWALGARRSATGIVPAEGWHGAGGMKKLHAAGFANCVFSSRSLDRGREDEGIVRQSFAATDPIHGRCFFPAPLGANRPGEVWQEIWIDGAKRAQVIYDPPIPAEDDQIPVELSKQQGSRLRELSGGKHTVSVWIYRQPEDADNPIPLAAGELVVRR
jgi:hypothetical protein